jgi:hypothetical protein
LARQALPAALSLSKTPNHVANLVADRSNGAQSRQSATAWLFRCCSFPNSKLLRWVADGFMDFFGVAI